MSLDLLPPIGASGIKRSWLAQAGQVALLVVVGIVIGIVLYSREVRLTNVEEAQPAQDSAIKSIDHRVTVLEAAATAQTDQLCSIQRAVHAQVSPVCLTRATP